MSVSDFYHNSVCSLGMGFKEIVCSDFSSSSDGVTSWADRMDKDEGRLYITSWA